MPFDQHAFISYAHIDNEPLTPELKGWVTQFHATLQTMLSQRLGEKARIWRDQKLGGSDIFGAEIIDQLARTALLISILSPRYLRSEWCTRELREFCDTAVLHGGLTIGNKSRVVKVVKTPFDANDSLPPVVQRTLGHEFFAVDGDEPVELDPAFGDRARQLFLAKLSGLAWEMAKSLQALMESQASSQGSSQDTAAAAVQAAVAAPARPAVFLAECGPDQRDAREQIATDLRMHGFEVLPTQQLPTQQAALVSELNAQLARCGLAVHLVGRSSGPTLDGAPEQSRVALQNQIAAERCRQGGLRRIIWLPHDTQGEHPQQQVFIDALRQDATLQAGADLLTGDLEALKGAIHAALRGLAAAPPQAVATAATAAAAAASGAAASGAAASPQQVHLLMTEADRLAAVPLMKLLRARGLAVSVPVFVGDAAALREANTRLVAECDALILIYGAGEEAWKFHQQSELRKQAASGRGSLNSGLHVGLNGGPNDGRHDSRQRSEWLAITAPMSADKAVLQALAEPTLIDALAGFSDSALQPLLAALATARGPA